MDNETTNAGTMFWAGVPSIAGCVEKSASMPVRRRRAHSTPVRRVTNRKIENAVYAHIQAVRTLGRTKIDTNEIAEALSIPVSQVNAALAALKHKGVKVL